MANKVAFEVVVTSKGFKVVQQEQGKLAKNIEKTDKSTKNLDKTQQKNYGRQKQGVIQTANQTKNFSKLSQTIGGSGGTSLVGAYATLAANVFAASAAFNALSRAAEFQKLREGLEIVGNQSGRTLSILADNLREATGMALTLEEASSAAAIGISGGFGEVELEGLARVAKGAALTLGRSLPDAFDRLTRGAIKLEPEILDELGIMVRLDDAVDKYAAQLGKTAGSLTQMERRTAFMNEILEQGAAKFGDIADSADSTPYQKLGATFGDLTKTIFTFFNETLMLNNVVDVLANSTTALFGTMLLFGSTIATQVVPALGTMGAKASARAADASAQAKVLAAQTKAEVSQLEAKRKSFKLGGVAYNKSVKLQKKGTIDLTASIRKLEIQEKARIAGLANQTKMTDTTIALRTKELKVIQAQIVTEKRLQVIRAQSSKQQVASSLSRIDAIFQKKTSKTLTKFTSGEIGMGEAMRRNGKEFEKKAKRQKKALKNAGGLTKVNELLKRSFGRLGTTLTTLTAGFVKFLPVIALITVGIGLAMLAFDRFYNTAERKAYNKTFKELDTILKGLPDKAKAYNSAMNSSGNAGLLQLRTSAILSNQITEINDKLKESIANRKELGETGISGSSAQMDSFNDAAGSVPTSTLSYNLSSATAIQELEKIESVLNTKLPTLAAKSNKALSTLFKVDQSVEVKALTELLNSDIPAYAKAAADSIGPFSEALAKGDAEGALKAASNIVDGLQKKFGDLNGAISGFSTALKDAEKVGSQFLQKFLPKTATSDIISAFATFEKGIVAIKEESGKAFGDPEGIAKLAASFSETGASIGTLLGGTFTSAQTDFNNAKSALDKAKQDLQDEVDGKITALAGPVDRKAIVGTAEEEFAKKQNKLTEEGQIAFAKTKETLILMNKQEIERKGTLEKIKALRQVEKSIMGKSKKAGEIQNTILREELQLRKDTFNTGNLILANSLNITTEEMKQFGVVESLVQRRKELVLEGGKELQIAKIDLQLQENNNILLKEKLNSAQAIANVEMASVAVTQANLKLLERRLKFAEQIKKVEIANQAAQSGRKTVDPIKALKIAITAEQNRVALAAKKAQIELTSAKIQKNLLNAQIEAYASMNLINPFDALDMIIDNDNMFEGLEKQLKNEIDNGSKTGTDVLAKHFQDVFGKNFMEDSLSNAISAAFLTSTGTIDTLNEQLIVGAQGMRDFGDSMVEIFGEEGAVIGALSNFIATIAEVGPNLKQSFDAIATAEAGTFDKDGNSNDDGISKKTAGLLKFAAAAQAVGGVIAGFAQVMAADSKQKIGEVDKQIEAEKKLDGKSKESLQKIATMEAKKEGIQRKAFETNKKLQIAQAIISTASGAAMALTLGPILGPILAGMIVALGLAQINMIKKTTFQGGGAGAEKPATQINIGGSRSNKVDVSQGASSGETAYLRGGSGVGSNANNFTPGGAMGRKGYAAGGMLVGERGPEVVTKEEIIPNYALSSGNNMNLTFNVSALDGASVQEVLTNNQGAVVGAIRDAANSYGQDFLPDVNVGYGGDG